MIKELFINSTILISAFFIMGQHFVDKPLVYYSTTRFKLLVAIMTGFTGSILVFFGVQLDGNIVVDFRYIALIVASTYGGPLASILGGLIIAVFRAFYSGISYASVIAAFFVLSAAVGCGIISKIRNGKKRKWILMVIYCQINSFFAFKAVIPQFVMLVRTFIPYSLLFIILGLVVYYCSEAINRSNMAIRKLKKESSRDYLTELNNLRSFDILYSSAFRNAQEKFEYLSLVVIDVDYFKKVNDTYGHHAGDAILKQLGELLREGCRSFDIVSRNGGEEFTMILINCPLNTAYEIAERIRKKVEIHRFILDEDNEISITVSLGIATYPDTAKDSESLFEYADKALYEAKKTGRNRVCCYNFVP